MELASVLPLLWLRGFCDWMLADAAWLDVPEARKFIISNSWEGPYANPCKVYSRTLGQKLHKAGRWTSSGLASGLRSLGWPDKSDKVSWICVFLPNKHHPTVGVKATDHGAAEVFSLAACGGTSRAQWWNLWASNPGGAATVNCKAINRRIIGLLKPYF